MRARMEIKMEFLDDQLALARIWPWSYLRAILEPTDAGAVVWLDILGFSPLSPLPPGLSSTFLPSFQSSLSAMLMMLFLKCAGGLCAQEQAGHSISRISAKRGWDGQELLSLAMKLQHLHNHAQLMGNSVESLLFSRQDTSTPSIPEAEPPITISEQDMAVWIQNCFGSWAPGKRHPSFCSLSRSTRRNLQVHLGNRESCLCCFLPFQRS